MAPPRSPPHRASCLGTRRGAALAAVAVAAAAVRPISARSILDFPSSTRQRNVVQLTRLTCDECVTMEDFYKSNRHVFVLFFERALVGKHHYKQAIIDGFHAACADLRYSHVACGVVDMVNDKEYATRYIDPKTAPAHIAVRDGEPLAMQKHHIERLMAKPGDKATILWHLRDVLASDSSPEVLEITSDARDPSILDRALARHETVFVGLPEKGTFSAVADAFRAAAQRLVLTGELPKQMPTQPRKGKGRQQPERGSLSLVLATPSGAKLFEQKGLSQGTVAAFVNGTKVAEAPLPSVKSQREESAMEALRSVVPASVSVSAGPQAAAAASSASSAAAAMGTAEEVGEAATTKPKRKRRRRRRSVQQDGGYEL